jgi:cell division protein ZapA
MGQVVVEIGGRRYPLSCRDGDEAHLTALADSIAEKAEGLMESLGAMSEPRLLLMAALMVADELHDARRGVPVPERRPAPVDLAAQQRLDLLVARAERLAERLAV